MAKDLLEKLADSKFAQKAADWVDNTKSGQAFTKAGEKVTNALDKATGFLKSEKTIKKTADGIKAYLDLKGTAITHGVGLLTQTKIDQGNKKAMLVDLIVDLALSAPGDMLKEAAIDGCADYISAVVKGEKGSPVTSAGNNIVNNFKVKIDKVERVAKAYGFTFNLRIVSDAVKARDAQIEAAWNA